MKIKIIDRGKIGTELGLGGLSGEGRTFIADGDEKEDIKDAFMAELRTLVNESSSGDYAKKSAIEEVKKFVAAMDPGDPRGEGVWWQRVG